MTKDEMVGLHYRLNGQEFEQTLGDAKGPGKPGVLPSIRLQSPKRLSKQVKTPVAQYTVSTNRWRSLNTLSLPSKFLNF